METTTQTKTHQPQNGNQQIIEYEIREISKMKYVTIRSFIESSTKMKYPWNVGLKLGRAVEFVKLGRWRLSCTVSDTFSDTLACVLRDRYGFTVLEYYYAVAEGKEKLIINGGSVELEYYSNNNLNIAFSSAVPFSIPIKIIEIFEKLRFYIDKIRHITSTA